MFKQSASKLTSTNPQLLLKNELELINTAATYHLSVIQDMLSRHLIIPIGCLHLINLSTVTTTFFLIEQRWYSCGNIISDVLHSGVIHLKMILLSQPWDKSNLQLADGPAISYWEDWMFFISDLGNAALYKFELSRPRP